jgi:hypothetical protein
LVYRRATGSSPALGPVLPATEYLARGVFANSVTRPGREAVHSSPSSVEVKDERSAPRLSVKSSWLRAQLMKRRDNLNLVKRFSHNKAFIAEYFELKRSGA